jgi:hypothetical protein
VILKVARPQTRQRTLPDGSPRTAIRTSRAILAANAGALTTGGFATPQDPVEFLVSAPTADPALDPPTASASVLPAGAAITVSVTLRNVGRDPASGMTVTLYQGAAGSGVALDSRTVAGPLPLNATAAAHLRRCGDRQCAAALRAGDEHRRQRQPGQRSGQPHPGHPQCAAHGDGGSGSVA